MNKFLLTFLALIVICAFGQDMAVYEGTINWDDKWHSTSRNFNCADGDYIYALKALENEITVQKESKENFEVIETLVIKGITLDNIDLLRPLKLQNNKLIFECQYYDKSKQLEYNLIRVSDTKTFTISDSKIISNKDGTNSFMANTPHESNRWWGLLPNHLTYSTNNQFTFICESANNKSLGKDGKGLEMIGRLYNSEQELINQYDFKIPYKDAFIEEVTVGNDGKVYILFYGKKSKAGMSLKGYKSAGILELLVLDIASETSTLIKIPENDGYKVLSGKVLPLDDGGIRIAGIIYPEKYNPTGIVHIRLNSKLEVVERAYHKIDDKFKTKFTGDDFYEKKMFKDNPTDIDQAYEFKVRDFILNSDGSTTYLLEQYIMVIMEVNTYYQSQTTAMTRSSVTYEYYFDNIIAINFSAAGIINWNTIIEKRQRTADYYSSDVSFKHHHNSNNDKIAIFYNESEYVQTENGSELSRGKKEDLRDNNLGFIVIINNEGEYTKQKINLTDYSTGSVYISNYIPVSNEEGILIVDKPIEKIKARVIPRIIKKGLIKW